MANAVKAMKEMSLENKKIDINIPKNGDYNSNTSIFINNLNENVTE